MEDHGKSYDIHVFANTDHAWLNVGTGAYRRDEAEQAWGNFTTFLDDAFSGRWDTGRALWRFESNSTVDYDLGALRQRAPGGGQVRLA